MSKEHTLEEEWASFEHAILDPIQAGPLQRSEMRKAWYSGAVCMFDLVATVSTEAATEDEGAAKLEVIHQEIEEFIHSFDHD
jgi:hypothetical protein